MEFVDFSLVVPASTRFINFLFRDSLEKLLRSKETSCQITPKFPLLLEAWGFGGLFLGEGPRNLSQILGAPKHPPNTHKSKNMASMRSSLLSLLLEHSFEEEETATMLIMLPHPGEATTQICFFLLLLIKYNNSLRFRSQLKRPALLSPRLSPWSSQTESVLKTSEY